MSVTPWWECMKLRPELRRAAGNVGDVQMSLYAAVYDPDGIDYADVGYYSEITHPTKDLLELMASVAVQLAAPSNAGAAKSVWRADQGMGGGKSHAEVGLYHMASDPTGFFATELGDKVAATVEDIAGEPVPDGLRDPVVVVLPCDQMDPFKPDKDLDNIAETLGERWLWRLFDGDLDRFKEYRDEVGTPEGIKKAMAAAGGTVLTLVDEVLNYVRKATAEESKSDRAQQDIAFLRDLMAAKDTMDHTTMVIVMIASEDDVVAMGEFGESIRAEMEGLLTRHGQTIATTSGGDFADILRRRLFTGDPPSDVIDAIAAAFRQHATGGWGDHFGQFDWWKEDFAGEVARCYPFHPALMSVVESEWANRAGFQKVRSTIQIFTAATYRWMERADDGEWAPPLIGSGDLPLSDTKTREALLNSGVVVDTRAVSNYREIAGNDVVGGDDTHGAARRIDVERSEGLLAQINPRAAERIATAMYVASLAPRAQGAVGATDAELRVAAFVPDPACDLAEIDATVTMLERKVATLDIKPGKGGHPRRLLMSTTQTLRMFFRTQRESVIEDDWEDMLRQVAKSEMSRGPFDRLLFVDASEHVDASAKDVKGQALTDGLIAALTDAGLDDATSRLVVLDPARFTLLNGEDSETRVAIAAALGLREPEGWDGDYGWPDPLEVAYASSCVFAAVNTYQRRQAVAAATDYVAWQRVCDINNVSANPDLLEQAQAERDKHREAVRNYLRKAYKHVVYLGENREAMTVPLDKDDQTALDGTLVWKVLAERDKTFDQGEFDRGALLHQLNEGDGFGKSLATVRANFYRSPRLPLLYDGDTDLKNALYDAQQTGDVVIINSAGQIAKAARPADINVTSKNLTLERPAADDDQPDDSRITGRTEAGVGTSGLAGGGPTVGERLPAGDERDGRSGVKEERVVVTLMGATFDGPMQQEAGYDLFSSITAAVDDGKVSFGKFQVEVVVPPTVADEIERAADALDATVSRADV